MATKEWIYITFSTSSLLLCLSGTLLIIYMGRNYNYWKRKGVPYIKPKLIFGNAFDMFRLKQSLADFFWQVHENCKGAFVGFYILDQPCLLIKDPQLVKDIFVKNFHIFPNRPGSADRKTEPLAYNLLFIATAPNWKIQRRNLEPLFSPSKLRSQISNFPHIAHRMVQYIKRRIALEGNLLNTTNILVRYSVQIVVKSFYDITEDTFENTDSRFLWVAEKVFNWKSKIHSFMTMCNFLTPEWAHIFRMTFMDDSASKFFNEFSKQLIQDRENANITKNDLAGLLIEIKKRENITDLSSFEAKSLFARVFEVFAAGYETVTTSLTHILFELAKHPECQSLARKDVQENIKKYGGITLESVNSMQYLKKCFLEGLRMHPISSLLGRRSIDKYQIPGTDIILDKGQPIYVSSRGFHRDPEYYPNPSQFDPERFSEENIKNRPDFTYMTFGFGQRQCPGQRFATQNALHAMAYILANFEVRFPKGMSRFLKLQVGGMSAQPMHDIYLEFIEVQSYD